MNAVVSGQKTSKKPQLSMLIKADSEVEQSSLRVRASKQVLALAHRAGSPQQNPLQATHIRF
jgi:hypothetical protein